MARGNGGSSVRFSIPYGVRRGSSCRSTGDELLFVSDCYCVGTEWKPWIFSKVLMSHGEWSQVLLAAG